ncbi:hypothetical protein KSAC_32300 (plasmid) [Komagataeibacter saccharivorans]|nr:hypothetical protein KSAC_32300 [Komagataeibacter saccharivorans]
MPAQDLPDSRFTPGMYRPLVIDMPSDPTITTVCPVPLKDGVTGTVRGFYADQSRLDIAA